MPLSRPRPYNLSVANEPKPGSLQEPIDAKIGDMEARIVEIDLTSGRIEHTGRLSMNATVTLQFKWRGEKMRLKAKIARTEMRSLRGKPGYISAVTFAASEEAALRKIVARTPMPPPEEPPEEVSEEVQEPLPEEVSEEVSEEVEEEEEEIEEIGADAEIPLYVRCTWAADQRWVTERVRDPEQPMQGFTMVAPDDESEIEDFCKTFEIADPETQRMMRTAFEVAIERQGRK